MIDSTDARALELALTYCQGKSIINSVNLEDGEEKFQRVCPWPGVTAPRSSWRHRRGIDAGAGLHKGSVSWRWPSGLTSC